MKTDHRGGTEQTLGKYPQVDGQLIFIKCANTTQWERTVCSSNKVCGETGQPPRKNAIRPLFHNIHKNQLKELVFFFVLFFD
jgi:hypothetical protein